MKKTTPLKRVLWATSLGVVGAAAFLGIGPARAVSTLHFNLDEAEALTAGEMDGAMALSSGQIRSGAQVERVELEGAALASSLVRAPDGTIYVGTGTSGEILRVRGDAVEVHASTGQLLVTSLAIAPDGSLFAGTIPEGRIYRVTAGGEMTEFAQLERTEHIWALEYDAERRRLYAGTGPEGVVFTVDAGGQASSLYDSPADHIMSLALGDEGTLYAGTSDDARVLRIDEAGRAETVHDFPGNEITALDFGGGELAVVANEFPDPPRALPATKAGRPPSGDRATQRPRPGKGRVFRVRADGRVTRLMEREQGHFTDIQRAADGTLFVAGGKEGRIFRVETDRSWAAYIDVEERMVLAIDMLGDAPVFTTGDAGALYRVVAARPSPATWTSGVLDARFRARWGEVSWRGSGSVDVQTRSGNASEPDDTWSDWSAAISAPGPVRSAAARYVQIRVSFARDHDAIVRALQLYYLPQNQGASVSDVRVSGPRATKQKAGASAKQTPRRERSASSVYPLRWSVENPDGDPIRFRLEWRREDRESWLPVHGEDVVVTEEHFDWETSSVADGWYVVRVEASDERANPRDRVLRASGESEPILVDNHAPTIRDLVWRGNRLRGRVVDEVGPIGRLQYAIDGGVWWDFFPEDGILDTRDERFLLDIPHLSPGTHMVAVRTTDAAANSRTSSIEVRIH